ncbi:MAG TPA: hypothetical protein VMV10_09110 [Pirellulales bacterium]|nr:hypothetical protein [Pirellulales bacterium]
MKIRREHWRKKLNDEWPASDLCEDRTLECSRRSPGDPVQNLRNKIYEREILRLTGLVNMLLVLVDPQDVEAALRLKETTPSNATMLQWAKRAEIPPETDEDTDEECPW